MAYNHGLLSINCRLLWGMWPVLRVASTMRPTRGSVGVHVRGLSPELNLESCLVPTLLEELGGLVLRSLLTALFGAD